MKLLTSLALLATIASTAYAEEVPLPQPRPGESSGNGAVPKDGVAPADATQPSACRARLTADVAIVQSLPPLSGPGGCGATDVVRLDAIMLPDGARVTMAPAPIMRCTMAEAVVHWVREDVAPLAADLGGTLKAFESFDSYECRGRNRVVGARLSEHGKANALDVKAFKLANGKSEDLTDVSVSPSFREALRKSACARFTTVLGPGSDGSHENHVHVDLAERHNDYRICQWDIRTPGDVAANVPAAAPPAAAPAQDAAPVAAATPTPAPREPAREPAGSAAAAAAYAAAKGPDSAPSAQDSAATMRLAAAALEAAKASFDVAAPAPQECAARKKGRRNGCAQQSRRSRHRHARSSLH